MTPASVMARCVAQPSPIHGGGQGSRRPAISVAQIPDQQQPLQCAPDMPIIMKGMSWLVACMEQSAGHTLSRTCDSIPVPLPQLHESCAFLLLQFYSAQRGSQPG